VRYRRTRLAWSGGESQRAEARDWIAYPDFHGKDWTHFYESGNEVSRLDYILVEKSLTVSETKIVRNGLSTKCKDYTGPRYPTVGLAHTEASDHCPVTVVLSV
jgi:endonuclease/exonuclease/phosphatase family metal-dependent hydrolase